jgi:hypothetical protein
MGRGADDPETARLGTYDFVRPRTPEEAKSVRFRVRGRIDDARRGERRRSSAPCKARSPRTSCGRGRRGHHRAGLLRRRPASGHPRRGRGWRASTCCGCSTSPPRRRSRTGSRRPARTACSPSTTSAAARSTSRSSPGRRRLRGALHGRRQPARRRRHRPRRGRRLLDGDGGATRAPAQRASCGCSTRPGARQARPHRRGDPRSTWSCRAAGGAAKFTLTRARFDALVRPWWSEPGWRAASDARRGREGPRSSTG